MKKFRTVISVFIMILCAVIELFIDGILNNMIDGSILGVLISGLYVLYMYLTIKIL